MPTLMESLSEDAIKALNRLKREEASDTLAETKAGEFIEVACHAGCGDLVKVKPLPVPEEYAHLPRSAMCIECAKASLPGKHGVVIRRHDVKRRKPRTTDGVNHPVVVKQKEHDMPEIDFSLYSDAQLAHLVQMAQERMRERIAEAMPANVAQAIADRTEANAADVVVLEADREARKDRVLPAFTANKVEVPVLDLSDITDLGLIASAKVRSPYNKILYRNQRDLLTNETGTYGALAAIHEEFMGVTEWTACSTPTEPTPLVVADVQPEAKAKKTKVDPAKVAALMAVKPDLTKKQARKIVASL